jgi:hypothetical protein
VPLLVDNLHHIPWCFEARIEADPAKGGRCEKLKEKAHLWAIEIVDFPIKNGDFP